MLTSRGLSYSKSRNDPPLCEIPTSELLAVERVDDQAFNMKFVSRLCVCWFVCLFSFPHSGSGSDVSGDTAKQSPICPSQEQSGAKRMVRSIHDVLIHRLIFKLFLYCNLPT